MSEVELHTGTLRKVDTGELTAEEWCKTCVKLYLGSYPNGYIDNGDINWMEAFSDINCNRRYNNMPFYITTGTSIYEVEDINHGDDFDLIDMTKVSDNAYSYVAQFYNGGTCLTEVLENELKNIEK